MAPKNVARNRRKDRSLFVLNPTTGALVVRPDLEHKVEKAIMREVQRIKLRLYFQLVRLYFLKLTLKTRGSLLRVRYYLSGYHPDLASKRHGIPSVRKMKYMPMTILCQVPDHRPN